MYSSDDPSFDELAAQIFEETQEVEPGLFRSSESYNSYSNNQIQPNYLQSNLQTRSHTLDRSSSPSIYDEDIEFEFQEPRNNFELEQDRILSPTPSRFSYQSEPNLEPQRRRESQANLIAPTPRSTLTSNLLQPHSQYNQPPPRAQPRLSAFNPLVPMQPPPINQTPRLQQYHSSSQQSSQAISRKFFPIPANGNISRRRDEHLRPAGGSSQFQTNSNGNYRSNNDDQIRVENVGRMRDDDRQVKIDRDNRAVERVPQVVPTHRISKHQSIEDDYFDDDDSFERAMVSMESRVQARRNAPAKSSKHEISRHDSFDQRQEASQLRTSHAAQNSNQSVGLRPVSNLPDMFRSLFKFGVFNAVQSTCFHRSADRLRPYIYNTNENVVVSAPTGAGKTALFELAMLRLFSTSKSNDSKVVYVAPTRSLCNERAADWKAKFGQLGLGWEVIELTGDSVGGMSTLKDVGSARVIVTTPEKWDAMTRKWHSHERVLAKIRLLCVDECHFVGMDVRGAVLEVIVSRFKTLSPDTRFIAVSATVPNVDDVAQWLGAGSVSEDVDEKEILNHKSKEPARIFSFGEEYRPCKLHKVVASFHKKGNDFVFASVLDSKVMELIKTHASGKAVLIFCNTRKGCGQTAETLRKECDSLRANSTSGRNNIPWPKPGRTSLKTNDKKLAALMESGIAYHHAGLDGHDRYLVEKYFLDGSISVVCATSTLAVGVNLPARMVIIKGTTSFSDGINSEYNYLDMLQMMGRAGRPQFDTLGVAVIMTDIDHHKKYEALANSETLLESCLHKNLAEHINSEISLRTIGSVDSALEWLRSTFLFIRINKRPKYYALDNSTTSPEERLEEVVVEAVKSLVESGVVDEEEDSLAPTELGNLMARFYLSHSTFVALQALPMKANMRTILECLANCSEYSSIKFRQGEKKLYADVNKNLRFPARQVTGSADKIMILIGMVLQEIPLAEVKVNNGNASADVVQIWKDANRILRCMVDLALERRDGGAKTISELLRSVIARAWEGSPAILRQLDGIGEKGLKALAERDICTFADVYNSEPSRLEIILNRNPPFGRKLVAQARSFPQFSLSLIGESEEVVSTGIKVTVEVKIGLAVTDPPPVLKKGRDRFWASVFLVTSDGEYIEVDQLLSSGKDFRVSVVLVKPSQRIIASISCDNLAGSEVKAQYKPTSKAGTYPLPTIEQRKACIKEISDDDETPKNKDQEEEEVEKPTKEKPLKKFKPKFTSSFPRAIDSSSEDEAEKNQSLVRLSNGKLACNHTCKVKTSCRHICCREGVDHHSRKKSKRKLTSDDDALSHPKKSTKTSNTSKSDKVMDSLEAMPVFNSTRPKARKLGSGTSSNGGIGGLKLFKPVGGRTTATLLDELDEADDEQEEDDEEEEEDLPTLAKAMEFSTTATTRVKKTPIVQTIFKKVIPLPKQPIKSIENDNFILDSSDETQEEAIKIDENDNEEEIDELNSSPSSSPPPKPLVAYNRPLKRTSSKIPAQIKTKRTKSSHSNPSSSTSPFRQKSLTSFSPVSAHKAGIDDVQTNEVEDEEVDELDQSQEEMKMEVVLEKEEVVEQKEKEKESEIVVVEEEGKEVVDDDEADFDAWLSNVTVI